MTAVGCRAPGSRSLALPLDGTAADMRHWNQRVKTRIAYLRP